MHFLHLAPDLQSSDSVVAVEAGRCVFVGGGQSNGAQYFDSVYEPVHTSAQFQFLGSDGTLRAFIEPIFGTGSGQLVGSLWGKLGDDLIDAGVCTTVVWALTALGGTNAAQWSSTGIYGQNVTTHIRALIARGIAITAVLWMQGETDTQLSTSQASYFTSASDMIRMSRTADFWLIGTLPR